jgi:hypothetical protein
MAYEKKGASFDVALLYAPTDDGKGARVLRARDGSLETGEVRPIKEGQPINRGELVKLTPRAGAPSLCDVEVLHQRPQDVMGQAHESGDESKATKELSESNRAVAESGRPAQVATDDYRMNWDRIFGRRTKRDRSLN